MTSNEIKSINFSQNINIKGKRKHPIIRHKRDKTFFNEGQMVFYI